MIIRDSYPVQNYGQGIKCPRRGMGHEGVDCNRGLMSAAVIANHVPVAMGVVSTW